MQEQPQSPVETPTTPSTPNLPFPLLPSFTRRRSSVSRAATATTIMRRRRSSVVSIPTSPLDPTIVRPLPIRPHKITKTSTSSSQTGGSDRQRSKSPTQKYHLNVITNPISAQNTRILKQTITHLETPLVPLVSVSSGIPHPEFPTSILRFNLLTHEQLDELARFYHQITPPVRDTYRYPTKIPAWVSAAAADDERGKQSGDATSLETKRRRWGRFLGLRGCETPTEGKEEREAMEQRMEREWRRALERARDEERLKEKGWRGMW